MTSVVSKLAEKLETVILVMFIKLDSQLNVDLEDFRHTGHVEQFWKCDY